MPIAELPPDFPEPEPLSKEYLRDEKWVNKHYGQLTQKYPDQWIAVYEEEVVSANESLGEIEKAVKSKNFNQQCVYVYVEDIKRVLGLSN